VNVHQEQPQVQAVRQVLASVVGSDQVQHVRDDDPLFELRVIDSLHVVEFIERIEATFGLKLDGADLTADNFSSLLAISRFVEARRAL
jgi:acyl carrier protein